VRRIAKYASNRSVPIIHGPGNTTVKTHTTTHWWRNEPKPPVELFFADLFPEQTMHTGEEHRM
jgi:hypothetical protein